MARKRRGFAVEGENDEGQWRQRYMTAGRTLVFGGDDERELMMRFDDLEDIYWMENFPSCVRKDVKADMPS
ncbi:hypothetical protein Dsin_009547 [Dipteronia sinensis]|uniref:Uncharacterized protein n=1 Tax=Dipteronia sinensis TaxID=43782 RepID=A0AAE0AS20_9ROSI|nr:hypothetical protein Dsin_009547 [Dipteronia sinensis]